MVKEFLALKGKKALLPKLQRIVAQDFAQGNRAESLICIDLVTTTSIMADKDEEARELSIAGLRHEGYRGN